MNSDNNNKQNQENISFYDQVDAKTRGAVKNATQSGGTIQQTGPADEVTSDEEEKTGAVYSKNLMNKAEAQVRENEEASLQDDSYSFDEDNTADEEFHDVDEDFRIEDTDIDYDNDEDFVT
jgi:hypothetical protein